MPRPFLPAVLLLATILATSGCAEPPHKEMDQAQGAIDAARAAGAEQYATAEYAEATSALKSAHDAVALGDYRLALNHALTSHERAQTAARETADTKAAMRANAERTLAELDALIDRADERIEAARRSRTPARRLAAPVREVMAVRADLQEAREAVTAGDYFEAEKALEGIRERIDGVLAAIAEATTPAPARRRR